MWCAYRGCRTHCNTVNIDVLHLLHTGPIARASERGAGNRHMAQMGTHRGRDLGALCARLRHQEVFGSDRARAPFQPPEVGGTLHKRDLAVPSPVSSVTPLHRLCTQGKARQWGRPDMGTTRRTGLNTSPNGVRDERERAEAGVGKQGSGSRPIHAVPLGRCHG